MRHVAILVHEHDAFEETRYFMREIAAVWQREKGMRVSLLRRPTPPMDVDFAVLHVDLTVVPPEYLTFIHQYPVVMNGRVTDNSKRRISGNLVHRGDDYDGPVIVKTNRNFGGTMEARMIRKGPLLDRLVHSLRSRLPWGWQSRIPITDYPVFESMKQVPQVVWYNPDLVVERFLPERRDGHYCLRVWMFLGDQETSSICQSAHPVVKSSNIIRRQTVSGSEIPEDLRRLRRELGFDFGKFDYAIVDGRAVLYDANRTPSLGGLREEWSAPTIRRLAEGIHAFI
jgi:hypothetical protein